MYTVLYFYAICGQANWAFREILKLYLIKICDEVLRLPAAPPPTTLVSKSSSQLNPCIA